MKRELNNEIRKLQNKLNNGIIQNKLNNKQIIELSNEIDKLINHYYLLSMQSREFPMNSKMKAFYDASYKELIKMTIKNGKFPELEEWNKYAKENYLLSTESMKYITKVEWKYIRLRVNKEINSKK
ncbi:MAG: aspartyl-phosphate phosphatase Spo0E family protein [Clostridia bacterium]|nr:aspartyl-phosphate phosphatase Spo0E family protein [Clostridia bacterium]